MWNTVTKRNTNFLRIEHKSTVRIYFRSLQLTSYFLQANISFIKKKKKKYFHFNLGKC